MFVSRNAFRNFCHGHGDTVIGSSLALNNFVRAVSYFCIQSLCGDLIMRDSSELTEMVKINSRNVCSAPYRKLAVPMFAYDDGMNASCVNIETPSDKIFQPRRIKYGSGSDNPLGENPDILIAA